MTLAIESETDAVRRGIAGRHRLSLAEYHKLGESGVFEDKRTELVCGVFYVMPLPDEPHARLVTRNAKRIRRLYPDDAWEVREEKGIVVGNSDVGPDISVVRFDESTPAVKPSTALLIVEIAISTLSFDLNEKAHLYAAAGVPLYLVVAPKRRTVYVHAEPREVAVSGTGFRYASVVKLDVGQSVTLNDPAATSVAVAELLGVASPA